MRCKGHGWKRNIKWEEVAPTARHTTSRQILLFSPVGYAVSKTVAAVAGAAATWLRKNFTLASRSAASSGVSFASLPPLPPLPSLPSFGAFTAVAASPVLSPSFPGSFASFPTSAFSSLAGGGAFVSATTYVNSNPPGFVPLQKKKAHQNDGR